MIKTDEVIFQTDEDANEVLTAMKSLLNQYEQVTFADMLELSGIASNYFHNKLGWTDLAGVEAKAVKDGYILALPEAVKL